jgi:hypothetical protein
VANGHYPSQWALKVTRVNEGELDVLQMSSNWGAPSRNVSFIYRAVNKQGTNERKLLERLCNDSMECLRKLNSGDTMSVLRKQKRVIIPLSQEARLPEVVTSTLFGGANTRRPLLHHFLFLMQRRG